MNKEQTISTPKKRTGLILGLCLGTALFSIVLFVAVCLLLLEVSGFRGISVGGVSFGTESEDKVQDDWSESESDERSVYDGKSSGYVPAAGDEFYREIVDCVRENLTYQVTWEEFSVENVAEQVSAGGIYPQLSGDIPDLESLNDWIREEVLYYKNVLEEYGTQKGHSSASTESVCYVTYMDEQVISIVLSEMVAVGDYQRPELHSINIDVKRGKILDKEELLEYSVSLVQRVKEQNDLQNEGTAYISELEDAQLLEMLSGPDGILFFTPLGMELGINYELEQYAGWVTVTLKDYHSFGSRM